MCVGFPPGAVIEPVSPQLSALSLKAHLQRSLLSVGPGRDYAQWVPGHVAVLASLVSWHRETQAKPSPRSLRSKAVDGTEPVLKKSQITDSLVGPGGLTWTYAGNQAGLSHI